MESYINQIANAQDMDELCEITRIASEDSNLTNGEYFTVFDAGVRKAQEWRGF